MVFRVTYYIHIDFTSRFPTLFLTKYVLPAYTPNLSSKNDRPEPDPKATEVNGKTPTDVSVLWIRPINSNLN